MSTPILDPDVTRHASSGASTAACCTSTCCTEEADNAASIAQIETSDAHQIRAVVRDHYARTALTGASCGGCSTPADVDQISAALGYSEEELRAVPEGANLGLGCGNPTAIDAIPEGATVLDLGSGAGFDCFLAARKTGTGGRVIGVDMTPEMIERARANAARAGFDNVEFRLGEIESLPVADASVEVIISNCVINLSPDKPRVFAEAFRVLKPGGRLMISDIVLTRELPDVIRANAEAYAGCLSGAERKERYLALIEEAGFDEVEIAGERAVWDGNSLDWLPDALREEATRVLGTAPPVVSLQVTARKHV